MQQRALESKQGSMATQMPMFRIDTALGFVAFFFAGAAVGHVVPSLVAVFGQTPGGTAKMFDDFLFDRNVIGDQFASPHPYYLTS